MLGRYVRSLASVRGLAFGQVQEAIEDVAPFGAMARLNSVTAKDVMQRQAEHFREDSLGVAVGSA